MYRKMQRTKSFLYYNKREIRQYQKNIKKTQKILLKIQGRQLCNLHRKNLIKSYRIVQRNIQKIKGVLKLIILYLLEIAQVFNFFTKFLFKNFIFFRVYIFQMSFSISKEQLASIVQACQKRTFAEEVQIFEAKRAPLQWLASGINTDLKSGIFGDQEDKNQRLQFYGTNQKPAKLPPGFFQLLCEALQDFTLRILIVASLVTIAVQVGTASAEKRPTAWIEGFAILVAVFISAFVTAINDYQKQRQFMKLNQQKQKRKVVTVFRNNEMIQIHQDFVLVGDVVNINGGMEVPADGFLIQSNQIVTDQSAMTGQTKPIKKNTLDKCIQKKNQIIRKNKRNESNSHSVPSPIMLSGTNVLTGEGKMIVIVVGDLSCLGKIRSILAQDEDGPTPLQSKLQKIAQDIGKFGICSSVLILIILLIRFGVQKGVHKQPWDNSTDLKQLLQYFILALTVVVVAIPEGLPLAVTLSLAFSVKKMLVDNNLVRKLQACQTMGGANNICSDKTGTLTKNQMTLTTYWNQQLKQFPAHKQNLQISEYFANQNYQNLYKLSSAVNGSALLKTAETSQKGSATQLAILKLLRKMGFNYLQQRQKNHAIQKFPFNSERKRMSTIVQYDGKQIILLKGASQIVLQSCNRWMRSSNGQIENLEPNKLQQMKNSIVSMAKKSLRTLCFAYKQLSPSDDLTTYDSKSVFEIQKSGFILLTIIGVKDIPRPEVPDAIRKCKKAGITVRMVTGDNLITAKAIAEQIGIIAHDDTQSLVMEGKDFIQKIGGVVCTKCRTIKCQCPINIKDAQAKGFKSDDVRVDTIANAQQFDKIFPKLLVLARSRPEDKYALVTGLKQRGNVVAVTGDGTNDAPALKKADVGFAMGIAGTQVAKQASAIILLDDNFDSIVKAVLWGRNIYDSIRKFLQFQLTVNVVAVGITLTGAALLKQQVLRPIQMLWLNLIMDTLGSLALATQPPTQSLLQRHPHQRDDYIISKTMFKHIIGQALFQIIILIILLFLGDKFIPEYPDNYDLIQGFLPDYKYGANGLIRSGRMIKINGDIDYQYVLKATGFYSRHSTFIFNTFVMLQVFNFLNSRKINDQFNTFGNITNNMMFILIVFIIFCLQLVLLTFAGTAFGVYNFFGLHPIQWGISIAIGSLSLVNNLFLKLIPSNIFPQKGNKEADVIPKSRTFIDIRRRSSRTLRQISHNNQ